MLLLACAMAWAALWLCGCTHDGAEARALPNAPIDRVAYAAPEAFGDVTDAWLYGDTRTAQRWWVLRMRDGQYVVLPVVQTGDLG